MSAAALLRQALADRGVRVQLEESIDAVLAAWHGMDGLGHDEIARLDAAITALEDIRNGGRSPGDPTGSNPEGEGSTPSRPATRKSTAKKRTASPASPSAKGRRRSTSPPGSTAGEPPPSGHKRCGSCDTTKPVAEFGRNRTNKDGLNRSCKPCHAEQVKASAARRKQRDAAQKERPVADPVDREDLRRRIAEVRDRDPAEAKRLTDQLMDAARDEVRR